MHDMNISDCGRLAWWLFRGGLDIGLTPYQGSHSDGLENLEKWEGIFQSGKSQGILNRLEKSGKITQNTGKLREFQTNIIFYFLVIFKLTVYYFAEMHQIFSYKINF